MVSASIVLNDDQCRAMEEILAFLDSPTKRLLTLSGVAGTGKTTLLKHLFKEIAGKRMIAMTAPTNKAVKVIREMAAGDKLVNNCFTTFSLFNLRIDRENELKTVNYEKGRRVDHATNDSFQFDTIVVDEASMVSSALFKYLIKFLEDHERSLSSQRRPLKFIFVGDPLQLPPVHEDVALPFTYSDQLVSLETVVRQALDNPIIRLTEKIRSSIKTDDRLAISTDANPAGQGVWALNGKAWERIMATSYLKGDYRKDQQCYRTIAYRNVRVDYLNSRIRELLYGDNAQAPFVEGERVLAHMPVYDPENVERKLLHTDEEAVVSDISVGFHQVHRDVVCWKYDLMIEPEGAEKKTVSVYSVHPEGENRFLERQRDYVEKKSWKLKNDFEESFARLRPVHAMTSHKSQGSTFPKVFVDADDILSIPDKKLALKSLYVAVSRASEKVALKYSSR